jgi:hypothetical protein
MLQNVYWRADGREFPHLYESQIAKIWNFQWSECENNCFLYVSPCSLVELCRRCGSSCCLHQLGRWVCSQNSSTGPHTERSYSATQLQTLFLQYRLFFSFRRTNLPNDLSPSNVPIEFFLSFTVHHTCYTFQPYILYLITLQNYEILDISPVQNSC